MATTIKLKNGSGAPLAGDLVQGEPALDLTNKRLYTEDSGGTVIEVGTNPGTDVTFADNRKAIFGAGSDLQIYHDGSHSRIDEQGTGVLFIQTNGTNIQLNKGTSENMLVANVDGSVDLYYDNSKKLATTSTGIDVTGDVNSDSVTTGTFTSTGIDDNATSTAITIDSSENVGIGTASPDRVFHVSRSSASVVSGKFESASTSGSQIVFKDADTTTNDLQVRIGSDANDLVQYAGGSERMRIDSSGNVGIGTSSPDASLTVKPQSSAVGTHVNQNWSYDSTSSGTEFDLKLKQVVSSNLVKYTFDLRNSGTSYDNNLVLDRGNVGIGTSSPDQLLDVGDHTATGNRSIRISQRTATAAQTYGGIEFFYDNSAGTTGVNAAIKYAAGPLRNDGELTFHTGASASISERLRIDHNGNVGIGTTSPSEKLNVSGNIRVTSGFVSFSGSISTPSEAAAVYRPVDNTLAFSTANTERMRIDSSGNVGIGTSSPSYPLEIQKDGGGSAIRLRIKNDGVATNDDTILAMSVGANNNENQIWFGDVDDGNVGQIRYDHNTDSMEFHTNASERMRIDSSGNLLVGTTTSRGRITSEASSGFCFDGYITTSSAGQDIFVIRSDVGGTANANLIIEANGDVQNTNNSYGSISDERLKSNIVDASSQIDDIMAVQVRSYTLDSTGDTHIGVVAQELEASGMSGLVKTNDEGMKSVKYSVLYMKAIKALQEAVTRIETLEAEVAALKGA